MQSLMILITLNSVLWFLLFVFLAWSRESRVMVTFFSAIAIHQYLGYLYLGHIDAFIFIAIIGIVFVSIITLITLEASLEVLEEYFTCTKRRCIQILTPLMIVLVVASIPTLKDVVRRAKWNIKLDQIYISEAKNIAINEYRKRFDVNKDKDVSVVCVDRSEVIVCTISVIRGTKHSITLDGVSLKVTKFE